MEISSFHHCGIRRNQPMLSLATGWYCGGLPSRLGLAHSNSNPPEWRGQTHGRRSTGSRARCPAPPKWTPRMRHAPPDGGPLPAPTARCHGRRKRSGPRRVRQWGRDGTSRERSPNCSHSAAAVQPDGTARLNLPGRRLPTAHLAAGETCPAKRTKAAGRLVQSKGKPSSPVYSASCAGCRCYAGYPQPWIELTLSGPCLKPTQPTTSRAMA